VTTPAHGGHSRLVTLDLAGPAGLLEAVVQERDGAPPPLVAVVCHPHPLYGGSMHNKVVHRAAAVLHALGAAVLRFNFRGVGRSEGAYDRGAGELEDARAALAFLRARHPGTRAWLAGFSFGSWVAARLAAEDAGIERLVLIAPPVATVSFDVLRTLATPKLVIQGDADDTCPPYQLHPQFTGWADPKTLVGVPGATHFFDRQLSALGHVLEEHLAGPAREG
jgi:alpha/beta superfamily hydrolase